MEDIIPKPLRVIKNQPNPMHELRSVSCSSYPSIPCRKSSLRVDWRQFSNDSRDSTETPPFSDNPKQIKIRKRGQANTRLSNNGQGNWQGSASYSAASDEVPPSLALICLVLTNFHLRRRCQPFQKPIVERIPNLRIELSLDFSVAGASNPGALQWDAFLPDKRAIPPTRTRLTPLTIRAM